MPPRTIDANAILDEREIEVKVKDEPCDDTAESSPTPDDQEIVDERLVAERLREEQEEIAKTGFTPTEAITDQEELANSTFYTYFTKSANGKYNTTDYIDNLKAKYMRLNQAWRKAEDDRDELNDIMEMKAKDPARYQQATVDALACIWKEALRVKKLSAKGKWDDHKAKAKELLSERRDEENQAKRAGVLQRKKERTAKAKAAAKEKAAKARAKAKGKATKTTSRAKPTKGRRS